MYTRILVAIDDSSTSAKALDEAVNLAHVLGAALCIAHVADEGPITQHGMGLGTYIDIDKVKAEIRQGGNSLLDAAEAKAAAQGLQAERILIESTRRRVAEALADAVQAWGADLVVIGTHGRRGFERLLVGSVAENLVRIAATSLMLVREGEAQASGAAAGGAQHA
jgi:nucleotide-binding universal stress UspA family protein